MVDIGKGSLAKYFVAAIIASTKRISEYYHLNCMLRHAPSQPTPTLKNPRNPVNPDSKLNQRLALKNPRNPVNPDSKLHTNAQHLKILEIL